MHYTIEAKQHPLMKTRVGHLYIEIWDPHGQRLEQINGMATDRTTGVTKRIGLPQNQLKGYLNLRDNIWTFGAGNTQSTNTHHGVVLFQGSRKEIETALQAAARAVDRINESDFGYSLLGRTGYNSNSVFNTVALAMQQALPGISSGSIARVKRLGISNPGCNKVMLEDLVAATVPADVSPLAANDGGRTFAVRALLRPVRRMR